MDFISKIIGLCLFALPLTLLNTLESNLDQISEDNQIALNAIESVLIVNSDHQLLHFDDMDYTPVIDGHKDSKFDIVYDGSIFAATTISQYKQIALTERNGHKNNAELYIDDCNKEMAVLHWEEGAVMKIEFKNKAYALAYRESGLIREIKVFENESLAKTTYQLFYTDDEKIESLQSLKEGKVRTTTNFEYTESSISIDKQNWKDKNHSVGNKIKYIIDDLAITKISYVTDSESTISDMVEYIFNNENQLIRKVSSKPGKGITTILGYDYNEKGQLLKSSYIEASIDSILKHTESLYAYQPNADTELNLCNQKFDKIYSIYDEDGNLASTFKESSL